MMQGRVLGTAQGVTAGLCNEETTEEQPCTSQSGGTGVRRT